MQSMDAALPAILAEMQRCCAIVDNAVVSGSSFAGCDALLTLKLWAGSTNLTTLTSVGDIGRLRRTANE